MANLLKDIEARFDEMQKWKAEMGNGEMMEEDLLTEDARDKIKSFYRKEFISLLEGLKEEIVATHAGMSGSIAGVTPFVKLDTQIALREGLEREFEPLLAKIDKLIKGAVVRKERTTEEPIASSQFHDNGCSCVRCKQTYHNINLGANDA